MGRKSQNAFMKKKRQELKRKKKKEKKEKMEARKNQESSGKLEDMLAYVDEDGNLTDERPEVENKSKK